MIKETFNLDYHNELELGELVYVEKKLHIVIIKSWSLGSKEYTVTLKPLEVIEESQTD
jgi:hypothetical protein